MPIKPVNNEDLVEIISRENNISKAQSREMMISLKNAMERSLETNGSISIRGLGTFNVIERAARTYRNPSTGAPVPKPAERVVKFRPWKNIREAIN